MTERQSASRTSTSPRPSQSNQRSLSFQASSFPEPSRFEIPSSYQLEEYQSLDSDFPSEVYEDNASETLLPRPLWIHYKGKATEGWINTMTDEVIVERRVSYGRGGYGNIRRPSQPLPFKAVTTEKSVDPETGAEHTTRRSSIWSLSSSPRSRRASIVKLFGGRRGSKDDGDEAEVVQEEETVEKITSNEN